MNLFSWLGRKKNPQPTIPQLPSVVSDAPTFTLTPYRRDVKTLRAIAANEPFVRAAINARLRQVQALKVMIARPDGSEAVELQSLLDRPSPDHTWRSWLALLVEDVLTLGSAAIYVWRYRAGGLYAMFPVDTATIQPLPDKHGVLPSPPEAAYVQRITGLDDVYLTKNDLVWEQMSPRHGSKYGLSPVGVIEYSAYLLLRRAQMVGQQIDESNTPAFIGEVPEGWTPEQIAEFQRYWDAVTKGRPHRGRWVPRGTNATFPPQPAINTEFDDFLMRKVCAVFEVQPQELGYVDDVNLANGVVQEAITQRRGVRPMTRFISEVVNQVLELGGFSGYKLVWPEVGDRPRSEIRQDAQTFIPLKVMTVNEVRRELGLEELPEEEEPEPEPQEEQPEETLQRRIDPRLLFNDFPPPDSIPEFLAQEDALRSEIAAAFDEQYQGLADTLGTLEAPPVLDRDAAREWADNVVSEAGDGWAQSLAAPLMAGAVGLMALGANTWIEAMSNTTPVGNGAEIDPDTWALYYVDNVIGGVNAATQRRLAAKLAAWAYANQGGRASLRDIVPALALFSYSRTKTLASDVSIDAFNAGGEELWRYARDVFGMRVGKQWRTAEDDLVCPVCGKLNGKIVGLDEEFLPGVPKPKAHPNCRCWIVPVVY